MRYVGIAMIFLAWLLCQFTSYSYKNEANQWRKLAEELGETVKIIKGTMNKQDEAVANMMKAMQKQQDVMTEQERTLRIYSRMKCY
jgi:gas vesicle protein